MNTQNTGHVILVNERDEWLGTMEKLEAHKKGLLHRAFSVFVVNDENQLLLQRRAINKYHSGGLWTNTCCSHPHPAESTMTGAHRRLVEEMGFDCELEPIFTLRYNAEVGNYLIENEYDHVYLGYYNSDVTLNEEEACDYKWMALDEIQEWINNNPEEFTVWFKLALSEFITHLNKQRQIA